MSLFSGMRLTPGKKQTQSISAKVQQKESQKASDHTGSEGFGPARDRQTCSAFELEKEKENASDGSVLKSSDSIDNVLSSDTATGGTIILEEGAELGAARGILSTTGNAKLVTRKGTLLDDTVGTVTDRENPIGVKSDEAPLLASHTTFDESSKAAESDTVVSTTSDTLRDEPSSLFSFITDSEPEVHAKQSSETEFENVDSRMTSGSDKKGLSLEKARSWDGDDDLDPFSVDKVQKQMSDFSKLSFDLEGLEFAPDLKTTQEQINSVDLQADVLDDIDLSLGSKGESYSPVSFEEDIGKETSQAGKESTLVASGSVEQEGNDRDKDGSETIHNVAETGRGAQYDLELDFTDQLELTLQMHKAKLRHFSEALEELTSQVSTTTSGCIQSSCNLLQKQQMLKQIQIKQNEAITKEDYEQAELLNEQCTVLENELQNIPLQTIPSNHPVILDIIGAISKLHEEKESCRIEQYGDLNQMKKKQEVVVEEVKGHYGKMEISEKCGLEEEESSLQRDKGHLDLDKEHLCRKEKQLEKRMDEKTCDLRQEKEELCVKRNSVQEEVAELEKKLLLLKNQESELTRQISQQEDLILKAKEEFKEEVIAIEGQRSEVKEKSAKVKMKEDKVKEMEERMRVKLADIMAKVSREQTILETIMDAIRESEEVESESTDHLQKPTPVFQSKESSQSLSSLQEKLKGMGASVQILSSEVLQAQTKIVSLRQRVSDVEGHIAALNEAKQMAVSGRSFAEAKRLANEIKELTAEGQQSQLELEKMIETSKSKSKELDQFQEKRNQIKTALVTEELKYDSDLKDWLLNHIQTTKPKSKHGTPNSLSHVLHEADIKACAMLVQYLCVKHGDTIPDDIEHMTQITIEEDKGAENSEVSPLDSNKVLSDIQSKIGALESQLQAAVDDEDYDAAQLLQEQIEALQTSS